MSKTIIEASEPQNQSVSIPDALQFAIAQHRAGQLDQAEAIYVQILNVQPQYADVLHLQAALWHQRGRHEEALAKVEEAMALSPGQTFYHNTRGRIFLALGRGDEALSDFRRAVEIEPQNAEAHFNLGETLLAAGLPNEAVAAYHRALTLRPIYPEANAGYAVALRALGDTGGALPYAQLAHSLKPKHYVFALNLALTYHMLGHLDLAIGQYEAILQDHPDADDVRINLASVYVLGGQKAKGIELFRHVRQRQPENPVALDGVYEAARQACDWQDLELLERDCMSALYAGLQAERNTGFRGFTVLYLPCSAREIRENNRLLCQHIARGIRPQSQPAQIPHPRLRIGYLSADVKEHPTAHLILELFDLHDRERFEIFLYSWAADDKSTHRSQIKASAEHFRECYRLPDEEIAALIVADEIDILVDLMGHTADNRLGVLARRPAPLQLGYLGYPGPYGGLVDYLIADPVVLPEGAEGVETVEAVARMPHCYQINSHRRFPLQTVPGRQSVGLPDDGFVFCCMNNSYKIDLYVFQIWCRLLHAVPGSVLWLLAGPQEMSANLVAAAQAQGIAGHRLIFAPRMNRESHLTRLQTADLFLDTRFYNAHTTATDALWAGVPVLTVAGRSFSARVAASLLHAVNMPELVQKDWDGYEAQALRLARDKDRLCVLRKRLIEQRAHAPLFDTPRWVRNVEHLYEHVWEGRNEVPESFTLKEQ